MKKVSVIVSVYNEEKALSDFYRELSLCLENEDEKRGISHEILFVNDGSTDKSEELITGLKKKDSSHVSFISFSRNFGHEAAMTAGLDYAGGDILIFMDADLQHPPACIPSILDKFEDGYDVISMVRTENKDAGRWKNITSKMFYSLINRMSDMKMEPAASDFFAIGKKAADVLRSNYRERVRFLRGFVQNIGFRKTTLPYAAAKRVAGESHYSFKKLLRFSVDTIVCFSDIPLKMGIYAGGISGIFGLILIIYSLFTMKKAPSGYTTIIIALCFFFAVLFLVLGIIGEYLAVLFREIKDRPIYIIKDIEKCTDDV